MLEANVFSSVPKLWFLDLSHNLLESLDYRLFSKLFRLLYLDLTNNRLNSLHDKRLFISQGRLSSLLLGNNELQALDLVVIVPLKSIRVLNLTNNPFICNCEFRKLLIWWKERNLDTFPACKHTNASVAIAMPSLNSFGICDGMYVTITSTNEMEENDITATAVSGELLTRDGNVGMPTTGGIGQVSITEDNKQVPVLQPEGNENIRTEGYGGVSITEENGEDAPNVGGKIPTVLIVCGCVVLLVICLVTSFRYWRRLRTADCSEDVHTANYHGTFRYNAESDISFAWNLNTFSHQPQNLLQVETSLSAETELLQPGSSEIATEEARSEES
jgi:hypothetical protein